MPVEKKTYRNGRDVLEKMLSLEIWDEDVKGNRAKMTIAELMHVKMVKKALEGDIKAYAEVLDRVEGKAVQKIEEKSETTFISKPLAELVQFRVPTKTLDEATGTVIELSEVKENTFALDTSEDIQSEAGSDD